MKHFRHFSLAICMLSTLITGCQQSQSQPMNPADMGKPAPRPAELDRLNAFIGSWEGTMEVKDPSGKITKGTGRSTSTWEAEKRVALERFEGTMGEEHMSGVGLWSYDTKSGNYQMFWTDSYGNQAHGTGTYDEASKVWHMRSTMENPQKGTKMKEEATLKFTDPNTMEYASTMTVGGKVVMEMSGTSKRK